MVAHTNRPYRLFLLIALLFVVTISFANSESNSDLISELVSLRSAADSGVIRLNDDAVSRYITSVPTPRPYSLLIFFDAVPLHSKTELRLQDFRREFALVSTSFISNNNNGSNGTKLFFCDIDSIESPASFNLFAVESLPHICHIGPSTENQTDESDLMDDEEYFGMAEAMAEFVEHRTKLTIGPIKRPPLLSKTQISLIALLIIISTPILIKKIIKRETLLHDYRVWLSGAVFVYFFSVGGTMHNIIKGVPMFYNDHEDPSKLVFFYPESGMQLGAEGFAVGFLYTVVGLLLAFVTNVLVRFKNLDSQSWIMALSLFVSFCAVKIVIYLDNWKTGYQIHPYWPSSWR